MHRPLKGQQMNLGFFDMLQRGILVQGSIDMNALAVKSPERGGNENQQAGEQNGIFQENLFSKRQLNSLVSTGI